MWQLKAIRVFVVGLGAAALVAGLVPVEAGAASSGMPPGLVKCGGTVNIGNATTIVGTIHNNNAVFRYWVRVHAAPPWGWYGTITFDGATTVGTGFLPVGTSRSYPSRWIIPWGGARSVRYSVVVSPGEGVDNGYSVEVFSPYRCTFMAR